MKGEIREIELELLSRLMQDSRVSDREMSKKLGVSQPTVSRIRHRLEKEGYIRKYTILPNLKRLGYQLMAITFVRFREDLDVKKAEELRKRAQDMFREESFAPNVAMFERGMGFGYTGVIVSYHHNYTSYVKSLRIIKGYAILDPDVKSFFIDLNDPVQYRTLTFTPLAHHILTIKKKHEE